MTTLKSDRIKLRPWKPGDEKSLVEYANNRNVSKNMRDRFPYPYTLKDAEGWIAFAGNESPIINFAIEFNGEAVGGAGLVLGTDIYRRSSEIGYWLGEPHWGKGIATEAVKLLTDYAFVRFNLVRIFANVFEYNVGSAKVLEKAGYTLESRMKKSVVKDGVVFDQLAFVKLAAPAASVDSKI